MHNERVEGLYVRGQCVFLYTLAGRLTVRATVA